MTGWLYFGEVPVFLAGCQGVEGESCATGMGKFWV